MSDGAADAAAPAPPVADPAAPPGETTPPQRRSYVVRHWRGELSLPLSYWINAMLVGIVAAAIGRGVGEVSAELRDPRLDLAIGLALMLVGLVLPVWQIVGVWRSAGRHRARGGSRFWAIAARVLMVLGALRVVAVYAKEAVPQIPVFWAIAVGDRGMAHELRVLEGGGELLVAGRIGFGLTGEIEALLDAHPEIRRLQLASPGGRVVEARRLHDVIKSRGLDTYAAGLCASACTVAFMGGKERLIAPEARLGFHQGMVPGATAADGALANRRDRSLLLEDGVDPDFAQRAYATPNAEMWYPAAEELLRARVATAIVPTSAASGGAARSEVAGPPRAAGEGSGERDGFERFGLYGRWAVDCRAAASPANPVLSLTPIGYGAVAYHLSMGGSPADFDTQIRDVRVISDREIAFSFAARGATYHVVLVKSGDRFRSMQSSSDDGKVAIKDGVYVASGKETPSFQKCD